MWMLSYVTMCHCIPPHHKSFILSPWHTLTCVQRWHLWPRADSPWWKVWHLHCNRNIILAVSIMSHEQFKFHWYCKSYQSEWTNSLLTGSLWLIRGLIEANESAATEKALCLCHWWCQSSWTGWRREEEMADICGSHLGWSEAIVLEYKLINADVDRTGKAVC